MIFAIAGTQLPFPRLMAALDDIAARCGLEIVAQTADPDHSYAGIRAKAFMPPAEFDAHLAAASIVVAHAGIGTIIGAAQHRKPLVLMPRRAALGEHRNDHQVATAARFGDTPGVVIANDEAALEAALLRAAPVAIADTAAARRQGLIDAIAVAVAGR